MTTTLTGRSNQSSTETPDHPKRAGRSPRRSVFGSRRSRLILLGLLVAVIGAAVWAVGYSHIFVAKKIAVTGNRQATDEQVLRAAAIPDNVPLIRLSLPSIASRIEQLDAVSTADVQRDWPDGLRIVITERKPVAQVTLTDGYGLVGSDGRLYRTASKPSLSLPSIDDSWPASVDAVVPGDATTLADVTDADSSVNTAFVVANSMTRQARTHVATIDASDPQQITLTLRGGDSVEWGGTEEGLRKSEVLVLLLRHPASTYNVSVPDAPSWSG